MGVRVESWQLLTQRGRILACRTVLLELPGLAVAGPSCNVQGAPAVSGCAPSAVHASLTSGGCAHLIISTSGLTASRQALCTSGVILSNTFAWDRNSSETCACRARHGISPAFPLVGGAFQAGSTHKWVSCDAWVAVHRPHECGIRLSLLLPDKLLHFLCCNLLAPDSAVFRQKGCPQSPCASVNRNHSKMLARAGTPPPRGYYKNWSVSG